MSWETEDWNLRLAREDYEKSLAKRHPPLDTSNTGLRIVSGGSRNMNSLQEVFGDAISIYTLDDGIEDGSFIDARQGEYAEVTARHFGEDPEARVVLTQALHGLIERAVQNERHCNDFKGVWQDVLHMGRGAAVTAIKNFAQNQSTAALPFQLIITGVGRKRTQTLFVSFAGEALTFGLAEDF